MTQEHACFVAGEASTADRLASVDAKHTLGLLHGRRKFKGNVKCDKEDSQSVFHSRMTERVLVKDINLGVQWSGLVSWLYHS